MVLSGNELYRELKLIKPPPRYRVRVTKCVKIRENCLIKSLQVFKTIHSGISFSIADLPVILNPFGAAARARTGFRRPVQSCRVEVVLSGPLLWGGKTLKNIKENLKSMVWECPSWTVEVVLSGPLLGLGLRSGPDKTTSSVQDGHPYHTFKALRSKS